LIFGLLNYFSSPVKENFLFLSTVQAVCEELQRRQTGDSLAETLEFLPGWQNFFLMLK
jgi:hypothetical protein